jgi:hypothetical protein
MSILNPLFAQNTVSAKRENSYILAQSTSSPNSQQSKLNPGIVSSLILVFIAFGVVAYTQFQLYNLRKLLKFEEYKSNDLKKKLRLALVTIKKMETNPDLVHSREFNLDYLRLRMEEEMFHSYIVNRLKIKITQVITVALRPDTSDGNVVGIVAGGRQIDETFDVTYELQNAQGEWSSRILFRVQIKLTKLPTQSSTTTISQILDCIERYLSPQQERENWQPAIQGQMVNLEWDQNAKPTPLLVLEQLEEGVNKVVGSTW